MILPIETMQRRENDRIDMATDFRVVVELEVENLAEEWEREVYVWHRINDANTERTA